MANADTFDVVIVGTGAAGIAAARAALSAGASRVALVGDGSGATEMGAGWIAESTQSAGESPDEIASALAWLPAAGLRAAGGYTFATLTGMPVRAVSGPPSLLDLATLPEGPLGVLDVRAGAGWFADLVARSVHDATGRRVRVITPAEGAPSGDSARELARALDADGMIDALSAAVRPRLRECVALLCPPALGLIRDDVHTRLQSLLGIPVGEAGGLSQDPPGIRLARALRRGIPDGVERLTGHATVDLGHEGDARLNLGDRALSARAVVLATGGLASGGIVFDGVFSERCAGAPVWLPGVGTSAADPAGTMVVARGSEWGVDPQPWFTPDTEGRALATGAGVRCTPEGRVLGHDGRRAMHPWLFAAGAVVAGARGAYGATLGDALVQGHTAGVRAARFAKGG